VVAAGPAPAPRHEVRSAPAPRRAPGIAPASARPRQLETSAAPKTVMRPDEVIPLDGDDDF
jgi:hypothetical protein